MTAIRASRSAEGKFVQIANAAMQDIRLSYQARGIIAYVLSLPPDAHLTAAMIEESAPNGRNSVRSALRELEQFGYYQRTRTSGGYGQWIWDQVISDAPMTSAEAASSQVNSCDRLSADELSSGELPADKSFKDVEPKHEEHEPLRGSSSSDPASRDPDAGETPPGLDDPGAREDVDRICAHLADRVEQRYGKRPNVVKRWRTAARQMLEIDGLTEQQVHTAIDWCQDNEFWAPNVRSVPKLREKYIQLRAQAMREQQQVNGGRKQSTTNERVGAALDLAERYAAEERAALEAAGSPQLQLGEGSS